VTTAQLLGYILQVREGRRAVIALCFVGVRGNGGDDHDGFLTTGHGCNDSDCWTVGTDHSSRLYRANEIGMKTKMSHDMEALK